MSIPTPAQLAAANMGIVPNLVSIIESNGDHARVWNSITETFPLATSTTPYNAQLYAVPNSWLVPPPPPQTIPSSDGSLSSSPVSSTKV